MEKNGGSIGTTMSPGVGINVRESVTGARKSDINPGREVIEHESAQEEQVMDGEVIEKKDNIVNFADYIAEKGKNDGVDSAFEELAKEENREVADHLRQNGKKKVETVDADKKIGEDENQEKNPARAEVESLKARVDSLTEQNEELKTRVAKVEAASNQALISAFEMALILKKMIEEAEEDKAKKESLLAMLADIMAKMITMMLTDEKDQEASSHAQGNNVEKAAA